VHELRETVIFGMLRKKSTMTLLARVEALEVTKNRTQFTGVLRHPYKRVLFPHQLFQKHTSFHFHKWETS
jgi:hypothetical protein